MQDFSDEFKNKMQDLLGDDSNKFFDALSKPIKKAITANFDRLNKFDFEKIIDFKISPIEEVDNGYYIDEDIKIGKQPLHHLGVFYSQEPSAMYPVEMLRVKKGDIILDLCSAPGGKSIQILEKLNGTGLLVSNEIVYNRAKILYENLNRMGFKNFAITCNSPEDYEKTSLKFDKILIDAPCGGEGMFRRKDFDFNAYNNASIESNSRRQLSILNSVKNLLKCGGYLVYSTCTYDVRENEGVIATFLDDNPDFELIDCPRLSKVTSKGVKVGNHNTQFCKRRYPHEFQGEGQFMALLKKKGEEEASKKHKFYANGFSDLYKKDIEILKKDFFPFVDISNINLAKKNDSIFAIPDISLNFEKLNVLSMGVLMGNILKGTFKPAHTSFHTYGDIYKNKVSLNPQQLNYYLQGQEIEVDERINGLCVVEYMNIPLGGGKVVGNRLKNYYPKELRN